MSFRYYLYISDAKIDMLLAQIDPAATNKRTSEISVGVSAAKAKRTVETTGDQVGRLERVVRHLNEHGDVGTVEEPGQFFWGLLPMQWGPMVTDNGSSLVYFGGRDERTIVGLGGSAGHVVGAEHADQRPPSPSLLPVLLDMIDDREPEPGVDLDEAALASVHRANSRLRGPVQNVEFLAKRLLSGPSPYPELDGRDDMSVLLGSPLYVALAD
ncbi:hypothetical protein LWC34_13135 [Kibdelosporangium philippinense]|uniref:Uncharacterized protein n=1 Tax=Kibdelosporangium philippinense TaxID=211113 RepID=A0ABS8Z9Q3_9PSEU|nr:SAVMC3_10250 family protein [Kibdelosporangium philippinense]MCE7003763.1 hypothetical protein [Kibdelosporangium philippinense]